MHSGLELLVCRFAQRDPAARAVNGVFALIAYGLLVIAALLLPETMGVC